jgi:hypothetical protein
MGALIFYTMAKDKKTILIYADWITIFDKLEDDEAGKLIKHFFKYVNDMNPEAPDRLTDIIFEPIKQQLKRDLKRYEAICLRNRDNINKRWNTTEYERIRSDTRNTHKDTDKDTDTDKDKEKKIEARSVKFVSEVYSYNNYPLEMLLKFCNYWTEPNKSKTKMRFELEKVFDISRRLVTWSNRDKEINKNYENNRRDNKRNDKRTNDYWNTEDTVPTVQN